MRAQGPRIRGGRGTFPSSPDAVPNNNFPSPRPTHDLIAIFKVQSVSTNSSRHYMPRQPIMPKGREYVISNVPKNFIPNSVMTEA